MRFLLIILSLFGSAALAADNKPAVEAAKSLDQIRGDYTAALLAKRKPLSLDVSIAKGQIDTANARCGVARTSFEDLSIQLKEVTSELSASQATSDPLAAPNSEFRMKLSELKAQLETKIAGVKTEATKVGTDLTKATALHDKLTRDLEALDAEAHRMACLSSSPPVDCAAEAQYELPSVNLPQLVGRTSIERAAIRLTPEFHDCFPEEAPSEAAAMTLGTSY